MTLPLSFFSLSDLFILFSPFFFLFRLFQFFVVSSPLTQIFYLVGCSEFCFVSLLFILSLLRFYPPSASYSSRSPPHSPHRSLFSFLFSLLCSSSHLSLHSQHPFLFSCLSRCVCLFFFLFNFLFPLILLPLSLPIGQGYFMLRSKSDQVYSVRRCIWHSVALSVLGYCIVSVIF